MISRFKRLQILGICCMLAATEVFTPIAATASGVVSVGTGKDLECNNVSEVMHYYLKCGHTDPSECFITSYVPTSQHRDVPLLYPADGDQIPVAGVDTQYGDRVLQDLKFEVAASIENNNELIASCFQNMSDDDFKDLMHEVLSYPTPSSVALGYSAIEKCLTGNWDTGDRQFELLTPPDEDAEEECEMAAYSPIIGDVIVLKVSQGQQYSRPFMDLVGNVGGALLKLRDSKLLTGFSVPKFESAGSNKFIDFPGNAKELLNKINNKVFPSPSSIGVFNLSLYSEALHAGDSKGYHVNPNCLEANRDILNEDFCPKTGLSVSNKSWAWCPHCEYSSIRDVVNGTGAFKLIVGNCDKCAEILGTEYNERALKNTAKFKTHVLEDHFPEIVNRDPEYDLMKEYLLIGYALNDNTLLGFFTVMESYQNLLNAFIESSKSSNSGIDMNQRAMYLSSDLNSIFTSIAEIASALETDGSFYSFDMDTGFSKSGSREFQVDDNNVLKPFIEMYDIWKEYKDAEYTDEVDLYLFPSNNKDGLQGILMKSWYGIKNQKPWDLTGSRKGVSDSTLLTSLQLVLENKINGLNNACNKCGQLCVTGSEMKLGGLFDSRVSEKNGIHELAGALSHIVSKHVKSGVNTSSIVPGAGTSLFGLAEELCLGSGDILSFSSEEVKVLKDSARVEYSVENGAAVGTQLQQARYAVFKILKSKSVSDLESLGFSTRESNDIVSMSDSYDQVSASWLNSYMSKLVFNTKKYMLSSGIVDYNKKMLDTIDMLRYLANFDCGLDSCDHKQILQRYIDVYGVSDCGWMLGQTTHGTEEFMQDRFKVIKSLVSHCENNLMDSCIPDVWMNTCNKFLSNSPDTWKDFDLVFSDVTKHFLDNHVLIPEGLDTAAVYSMMPQLGVDVGTYASDGGSEGGAANGGIGSTGGSVGAFVPTENGTMNGGVKTCPIHNGVVLKNGNCAICSRGKSYDLQISELQYRPGTTAGINTENASIKVPQGVANSEITAAIEQNNRTAFWATVAATIFYTVGELLILMGMCYTTLYVMARGVAWFPKNWLYILSFGYMDAYTTSARSFIVRLMVITAIGIMLVTGWAFTWITHLIAWFAMLLRLV